MFFYSWDNNSGRTEMDVHKRIYQSGCLQSYNAWVNFRREAKKSKFCLWEDKLLTDDVEESVQWHWNRQKPVLSDKDQLKGWRKLLRVEFGQATMQLSLMKEQDEGNRACLIFMKSDFLFLHVNHFRSSILEERFRQ